MILVLGSNGGSEYNAVSLHCVSNSKAICSSIEHNLHVRTCLTSGGVDCTWSPEKMLHRTMAYKSNESSTCLLRLSACSCCTSSNTHQSDSSPMIRLPANSLAKVFNLFWFDWVLFRIQLRCALFVHCLYLHKTATTSKLFLFKQKERQPARKNEESVRVLICVRWNFYCFAKLQRLIYTTHTHSHVLRLPAASTHTHISVPQITDEPWVGFISRHFPL